MKVGQMVVYYQPDIDGPRFYNGHRDHPAVVTTTFGDEMVNLKVFFDCGPVEDRTSVHASRTEEENQRDGCWVPWEIAE